MNAASVSPILLTVRQVAATLRTSDEHVLALINGLRIRAINVGLGSRRPRWRVPAESLAAFLASRTPQASLKKIRKKRQVGVTEYF